MSTKTQARPNRKICNFKYDPIFKDGILAFHEARFSEKTAQGYIAMYFINVQHTEERLKASACASSISIECNRLKKLGMYAPLANKNIK